MSVTVSLDELVLNLNGSEIIVGSNDLYAVVSVDADEVTLDGVYTCSNYDEFTGLVGAKAVCPKDFHWLWMLAEKHIEERASELLAQAWQDQSDCRAESLHYGRTGVAL